MQNKKQSFSSKFGNINFSKVLTQRAIKETLKSKPQIAKNLLKIKKK